MGARLDEHRPIFIGFKMDGTLRRMLRSLTGTDQRYVSREDPSFLMISRLGEDEYVGKRIDDRLTTDRVDDVRRNVRSILQRLCPEFRVPEHFEILSCGPDDVVEPAEDPEN